MKNKKVYCIAITIDEFYDLLLKGDLRADAMVNWLKSYDSFLGVWQEPKLKYQVFVFDNSEDRTECFKHLEELDFKTLCLYTMHSVPECIQ